MQIQSGQTFIRFGSSNNADGQDKIKLPKSVEKRLSQIANKYNADVEVAKKMYQGLKGLKMLKLKNEDIYRIIDNDLNPNGARMSTCAVGEEGGDLNSPPPRVTQALHETGGGDTFQPNKPPQPQDPGRRITQATHETGI